MSLTANRNVDFYPTHELIDLPVQDNARIFKGAFVGRDRATGYARPLVAGDDFLGLAYREADNTVDGHAPGAVSVRLHQFVDIVHPLTGVTTGDIGQAAYASDDDTLTLNATGNSRVGRIVAVEGVNLARVRCHPLAHLTGVLENGPVVALPDQNVTLTHDHLNRTLLMANTATRTLTLPPVASARGGAWLRMVKTSAAAFAVTLNGYQSETIDGSATFSGLDARYDCALLVCTGTEWIILSRDLA